MGVKTVPLRSSWMDSATYDDTTQTLTISTAAGGSYTHPDVPENVFTDLVNASSPGRYYHANIKEIYV